MDAEAAAEKLEDFLRWREDLGVITDEDIKEMDKVWNEQGRDLIDIGFDKGTFDCFKENDEKRANPYAKMSQILFGTFAEFQSESGHVRRAGG